jgi:hypothetical protein
VAWLREDDRCLSKIQTRHGAPASCLVVFDQNNDIWGIEAYAQCRAVDAPLGRCERSGALKRGSIPAPVGFCTEKLTVHLDCGRRGRMAGYRDTKLGWAARWTWGTINKRGAEHGDRATDTLRAAAR